MPEVCCKETWDKIPDDEPIFIIRGQDLLAQEAIATWIEYAIKAEVPAEKINEAKRHLAAVRAFHTEHRERCKFPD